MSPFTGWVAEKESWSISYPSSLILRPVLAPAGQTRIGPSWPGCLGTPSLVVNLGTELGNAGQNDLGGSR